MQIQFSKQNMLFLWKSFMCFLVGRGTRGGAEKIFCVPKLDGFPQSGLVIRSDVSFFEF